MTKSSFNRREFLQLSASAAAMLGLSGCAGIKINPFARPRRPRPIAQGAKIRLAQVGFGGQGSSDIQNFKDEDIVALCDVDWSLPKVQEIFAQFPKAKRYKDFRQMLLEMDDQIDGVVVSVPDHMHFLVAYMAMTMGKHVYVQKPLTQTVWEANELLRLSRQHHVCSQMGNQGHSKDGCRLVKEWVQGGVIGPVREVTVWTNRPIWPQGIATRPAGQPVPAELDWDKWIGRSASREYNAAYHPFKWRGWLDFGAGALGDMGCHTLDAAFYALELGDPISVQAEVVDGNNETFPSGSIVTYEFPARKTASGIEMPPVKLTWYDGNKKPARPKDLEAGREMKESGQVLVGEKGSIYDSSDYCESPRIIPEAKMQELRPTLPKKTIKRIPQMQHYHNWLDAIRAQDSSVACSNFEYSVPLTKFVVLGNLAVRNPGVKLEWDGKKMQVTNHSEANKFVKPVFRQGWEPEKMA